MNLLNESENSPSSLPFTLNPPSAASADYNQAGYTLHLQMRSTDRLSEQETLDIQRAIAASLDPNMSSTSGNAVASTSASTLDAPPVRPVKQEQVPVQKRQAKELGSERDFNPLKLKQDALPWSMIEKNGPQMVLTDALYLYALGSGPPSLDEPPKVVRWGAFSTTLQRTR